MPTTLNRSLLVIIFPGLFAVAPWLFWLFIIITPVQANSSFYENYELFYKNYQLLVNAFLFAFVVVVGCTFEGMNSHWELKWDKEKEGKYSVKRNWHDYLALVCTTEPVGFKYIARTVRVMYFELAMVRAFAVFGVGVILCLFANSMLLGAGITALFTAMASYYFLKQARLSHEVLCVCRQELNARLCKDASRQTPFLAGCFS